MRRRPARLRLRGHWTRVRGLFGTLLARDTMVVTNAIAFNFLLCLFPLLLVLTAVAQAFPGRRASAALLLVLHEIIPFEREALAQSVQGLRRIAPELQIFSLLVIVWGSSGIFMPIELALGRAWGCEPRSFVRSRLLAFLATLGGALLAFLSVGVTVLARSYKDAWPAAAEYGARASALLLTYVLFFLIYRLIPDPPVGSAGRAAQRAVGGHRLGGREVPVRPQPGAREPAHVLRPARLRGLARHVGVRVEPGARLRRADGARAQTA